MYFSKPIGALAVSLFLALAIQIAFADSISAQRRTQRKAQTSHSSNVLSPEARETVELASGVICKERAVDPKGSVPIDDMQARPSLPIDNPDAVAGAKRAQGLLPVTKELVPFFDIPACTASGVAMLAIRANAVIVPMFAIWDAAKGKYFIYHDEIIEPVGTGDRKRDIEETTALCVAATERVIRAYPEQWIWIHRRWKTRPPGEKDLYE
jgi:hypothetical protein